MAEITPPADPFADQGAEKNIDRQKHLLNDLIAIEGQDARQTYEKQGETAKNLLAQQIAQAPQTTDARKAVYDAFLLDSQAAQQQHFQTMQRQNQFNHHFLDQAKAAVPIHQQANQQYTDALRARMEHEQEMERQRQAAARAAQRASGPKSYDQRKAEMLENAKLDQEVRAELMKDIPQDQWTISDLEKAGKKGSKLDPAKVARSLGLPAPGTSGKMRNTGDYNAAEIQAFFDGAIKNDLSWVEVMNLAEEAWGGTGAWDGLVNVYARAYAPVWGLASNDSIGNNYLKLSSGYGRR